MAIGAELRAANPSLRPRADPIRVASIRLPLRRQPRRPDGLHDVLVNASACVAGANANARAERRRTLPNGWRARHPRYRRPRAIVHPHLDRFNRRIANYLRTNP